MTSTFPAVADRLARFAQARLRDVSRGAADGEDVALSVLESFFQGVAAERFPDIGNRSDLWLLLVTVTARKASDQRRNERRQKRGGGRVGGAKELNGPDIDGTDFVIQVAANQPTPEFAAMFADEYRRLFASLADESLRLVALLKLEGHSNDEIATRLDRGLRTVERKLGLIRKRWLVDGLS